QQVDDVAVSETRLRRFAHCAFDQLLRVLSLGFTASRVARLSDERAESLAAVDDALSLELFVGALDRDHADEKVSGEIPEGGEGRAWGEPAFADFALEAVDNLLIKRRRARSRERSYQ